MNLFTWYDVEMEFRKARYKWPQSWNRVDVYNDEVIINIDEKIDDKEEDERILKEIFQKNYDSDGIQREFDHIRMSVSYEAGDDEDKAENIGKPLFKDDFKTGEGIKPPFSVPILVFDSYKGGVGRTLSLIALTKEIAEIYGEHKKVLVIDADIEAPGLTCMLKKTTENAVISYLDVLSLMHFNEMNDTLAQNIADMIKKNTFTIETEKMEVEEYFLPVYRKEDQIDEIYSTPEKIIMTQSNKYIVTEFLSQIGKAMDVDMILVDLRTGITEFSAPFLLDPRVQKYFVSSTSMQSVEGMQSILNKISKKAPSALENTKILLTMIPNEMEEDTIHGIEDQLAYAIEQENWNDNDSEPSSKEDYMVRLHFESPLIHLGNFQEICSVLSGGNLESSMNEIAKSLFEQTEEGKLEEGDIRNTLERIYKLAEAEVTAEGNASANMLSTSSLREIAKDFSDNIPQIVILGAKGAGKTYIYKQILAKQNWGAFLDSINEKHKESLDKAFTLPLISSKNARMWKDLMKTCINQVNKEFAEFHIHFDAVNENYRKITQTCETYLSVSEWIQAWQSLMIDMLGESWNNLEEIDRYLQEQKKQIVFIVDGLEDLVMEQTQTGDNWNRGMRALMQDMVSILSNLPYGNIGLIVFARKDIAEEAISMNFTQFRSQYRKYELTWTPTEALRLALWLAYRAVPETFGKQIDILKASRQVLEECLELLWGKKLGKRDSREAVTARWIIAALSDFTGELQARDIVRFLKYATQTYKDATIVHYDRYIMPKEIRRAIPQCSNDKYSEIKSEMKEIYQILKKFEDMKDGEKQLPLMLEQLSLTGEEIAKLQGQGYLSAVDQKYYFPEIIRFALGFRYAKGARPRVLSLLAK